MVGVNMTQALIGINLDDRTALRIAIDIDSDEGEILTVSQVTVDEHQPEETYLIGEATTRQLAEETDIEIGTLRNNMIKLKNEEKIIELGRKEVNAPIYKIKINLHHECRYSESEDEDGNNELPF